MRRPGRATSGAKREGRADMNGMGEEKGRGEAHDFIFLFLFLSLSVLSRAQQCRRILSQMDFFTLYLGNKLPID